MRKLLVSIVSICVVLCGILRIESHAGIIPTLISTESAVFGGEGNEVADFTFHFKIEAVGADAYIAFVGLYTNLFEPPGAPTYEWINIYLFSSAPAVTGDFGQRYLQILGGNTELFTYVVAVRSDVDTLVSMEITDIYWNDVPSGESWSSEIWNGEAYPVPNWEANTVFLPGTTPAPEPGSTLLVLMGGLVMASRRLRN